MEWNLVHFEIQGKSHVEKGIPCQDKTFGISKGRVQVAVLADGAGSARLSHIGAAAVTEFVGNLFADRFDEYYEQEDGAQVKRDIIDNVLLCLNETAQKNMCNLKDLASTLLVVAVSQDKFIAAHIGDGVVGRLSEAGLQVISHPDNGEYANSTIFTTSPEALSSMRLLKGVVSDTLGFVMMSDGPEMALYDKKEKCFAPVIGELIKKSQEEDTALFQDRLKRNMESVVKQVTTDDISFFILSQKKCIVFSLLDFSEKCNFLKLSADNPAIRRTIEKYDVIFSVLSTPASLQRIARESHISPKHIGKYMERLCKVGLVEKNNGLYHRIVGM